MWFVKDREGNVHCLKTCTGSQGPLIQGEVTLLFLTMLAPEGMATSKESL